jgi:hypothetical protein
MQLHILPLYQIHILPLYQIHILPLYQIHILPLYQSHFLRGKTFRKNIANASTGGVKIKVVLAGHSDVMLPKMQKDICIDGCLKIIERDTNTGQNVLHGRENFHFFFSILANTSLLFSIILFCRFLITLNVINSYL